MQKIIVTGLDSNKDKLISEGISTLVSLTKKVPNHSPYLAVLDTDSYIANPKRLDLWSLAT